MTNPTNRVDLRTLWAAAESFECGYKTPCLFVPRKPQPNGYVRVMIDGRSAMLHRAMYEFFVGPDPDRRGTRSPMLPARMYELRAPGAGDA